MSKRSKIITSIPEPPLSKLLFADIRLGWIWLILRLYVAWQWIQAGCEKIMSPLWVGPYAGGALDGFSCEL